MSYGVVQDSPAYTIVVFIAANRSSERLMMLIIKDSLRRFVFDNGSFRLLLNIKFNELGKQILFI